MIFSVVMGVYLLVLAADDMFNKSIPGLLLAAGAIPAAVSFFDGPLPSLTDRLLGTAAGLAAVVLAKVSKEKIGLGDAIVLCIAGAAMGLRGTAVMTGLALFLLPVYAVAMLARGRLGRKSTIPFLPFLFAGYVLMQFM